MNLPNILTTIRIFLIPIFILLFFSSIQNGVTYALFIFLLAGFTDILDGYIARKYDLVTTYGIVLDPLADKLMLITVLVCLTIKNFIPLWLIVIYSLKELIMISYGIMLYRTGEVVPANIYGKISTFLFYISIVTLIYNNYLGNKLLVLALLSSIIALLNYYIIYTRSHQIQK